VVAVEVVTEGEGTLVPAVLLWVATKVAARISAPRAAMIAGRGSSIRGALGTVYSYAAVAYCVFDKNT
jgi:hypothetical protein